MRKILSFFGMAPMILLLLCSFLVSPATAQAQVVSTGLIKGPGDTVYWYSANGKRYVFPTYNTFSSWYGYAAPTIQILSLETLGTIQIGGNVTYKPGVRMVKVTTDPRVYAIGRYGVLRWVTSEQVAAQLYGPDWARKIDDLPDPYFVNYKRGADINSPSDYSPDTEVASVSTPDDNLGQPATPTTQTPPTSTPTNTGARFATSVSRTVLNPGNTLTLIATLNSPNNPAITHFDILDPRTNEPLKTCWNVTSCDVSLNMEIRLGVTNIIFHARGYDASNTKIAEEWFPTVSIVQPSTSPSAPTITSPTANQVFTNYPRTMTVSWSNDGMPSHNVEVACDVCSSVTNRYSNPTTYVAGNYTTSYAVPALAGDNTFRVRVQAINSSGAVGTWSDYVYFSFKTSNTPVITSPTANQIFTNFPRTVTYSWTNVGAARYVINTKCDSGCWPVVGLNTNDVYSYPEGNGTSFTITLTGDDQMRVRVQPIFADGTSGNWSDYVYFSFRTTSATETLRVNNVLFQDATVNDNLGTKVGLVFNHQPYKVAFSFTSPAGQKILNGYSNVTKTTVTPYSDSYAMLMNNLASNVDYQYLVTATDWDGTVATAQGVYHSSTLIQAYAYLDYQVVGTSQQGQIVVSPVPAGCNSNKCGYNFSSRTYSGYTGGAFYSTNSDGAYRLYGNNVGQGGAAPIVSGDSAAPLVSSGLYNRFGVPLTVGAWYAVYDEANQMFIKVHVAKLVTP